MYSYSKNIYKKKQSDTLSKLEKLLDKKNSEFYNKELDVIYKVPLSEKSK